MGRKESNQTNKQNWSVHWYRVSLHVCMPSSGRVISAYHLIFCKQSLVSAHHHKSIICLSFLQGQIKKYLFRVTRIYLNLLVKPRIFQVFWQIYIILCILKGEMPFKMHKMILFSRKKKLKNYVCASPS